MKQTSQNNNLLEVQGLQKYFPVRRGFFQKIIGWIKAVDGVDFTIEKGKTLGLVGESGCGKSTIGRLILRLMDPDTGRVVFKNQDLCGLDQRELKPLRKNMQIVFQDPFGSLNPRMSVGRSIEEGLRTLGKNGATHREARVKELLDMVGLSPTVFDRYPHEFSGGQRQRIGIARALSVNPDLVICDEPVSALDVSVQAQIINLFRALQKSQDLTYLFIAHDLNVVGYISDMIAVMYLGHIMEYAPAETLFENPRHPYTLALLSAIPSLEKSKQQDLKAISGEVPSPFNPPPGCKFQGRCPLVEDRCRSAEIRFYEKEKGHRIRCWKVI